LALGRTGKNAAEQFSLGFLTVLGTKSLPEGQQLRGVNLWLLVIASALACVLGMVGGLSGLV
jgi:hypothetical protein